MSPNALPNIQSRILSPISRAERVLKKKHKSKMKSEVKLDSSIEASLEKIEDHDQFVSGGNDKIFTLFSSSKSSERQDDDFMNALHKNRFAPSPNSPVRPMEMTKSKSTAKVSPAKINTDDVIVKQRTKNIKANKKIFFIKSQ